MGEKQDGPFRLSFNASLKVDIQGSRVTSDGGLNEQEQSAYNGHFEVTCYHPTAVPSRG